jgi:GNAT superfamily N-acetyltransferase
MTDDKAYPDEPAGPFPEPPTTIEDREDRSITVQRYDEGQHRDALEAMYDAFDPADRAQGIPPTGEQRIADWLDSITGEETVNLVANHGDDVVGHATLVPESESAAELAIFVLQEYQGAGIGTQLLETLLGAGQEADVERVWLSVERWNEPAIALYEKVGFVPSDTESFEHEMTIRLA